jgi:hypothetical protein
MSQFNQIYGLTSQQFNYLSQNYIKDGFIPNPVRINQYDNPLMNVADRNWQEILRNDPNYNWSRSDQISWSSNCKFGPHNASSEIDKIIFKN